MKQFNNIIHYLITFFIIFGGSISDNCNLLFVHYYFCIITILHWLTNNNKCFLSEYDYNHDTGYSAHLLQRLGFNFDPVKDQILLNLISYMCVLIPATITLYKYRMVC
jgi:hypothetical protein